MGFTNKGNCYYYIKNDIAFCISFDFGGLVYCTAHVMPLYMPCEGLYYTFGDRLGCIPGSTVDALLSTAGASEAEMWFDDLMDALHKIILPFFNTISSPLQLLRFVNGNSAAVKAFFRCPPDQLDRLRVFTYLYLNDGDHLRKAIQHAYKSLSRANYTERMKEERNRELSSLEARLSDDGFSGSRFCAEIIERSLQCCFGK